MIRDSCVLSWNSESIQIRVSDPERYDDRILIQNEPALFLPVSRSDPSAGLIQSPIENLVSLKDFLKQSRFGRRESCQFLHFVLSQLKEAMRDQPAVLESRAIFLNPLGTEIFFVRAPLRFEYWMKRKEDLQAFFQDLLEDLDHSCYEAIGLIYQASIGSLSLGTLIEEFERLYLEHARKRLSFRKVRIPPYQAKKAIYPLRQDPSDRTKVNDLSFSAQSGRPESEKRRVTEPDETVIELTGSSESTGSEKTQESQEQLLSDSRPETKETRKSRRIKHRRSQPAPSVTEERGSPFASISLSRDEDEKEEMLEDQQKSELEPLVSSKTAADHETDCLFERTASAAQSAELMSGSSSGHAKYSMPAQISLLSLEDDPASERQTVPSIWDTDEFTGPVSSLPKNSDETDRNSALESGPSTAERSEKSADFRKDEHSDSYKELEGIPASPSIQVQDFLSEKTELISPDSDRMRTAQSSISQKVLTSTVALEELIPAARLSVDEKSIQLDQGEILIGRSDQCQVQLIDPSVSSVHARITCSSSRWYIQDLRSTNGTMLNGRKVIRRMRLKDGMILHFGTREAVFRE